MKPPAKDESLLERAGCCATNLKRSLLPHNILWAKKSLKLRAGHSPGNLFRFVSLHLVTLKNQRCCATGFVADRNILSKNATMESIS